ncbi:valine--tRNA ligase [Candidatus Endowatersipora endosymbiont of Watersipora subatra]|uniref:valine--tRNA ligase n=1 Tax=Candidatus Endowatersipora endosymbiont of Watersipora subatra TaxID=3077946 RepID=UPI00312CB821
MLEKTYDHAVLEAWIDKLWEDKNAFSAGVGAEEGSVPYSIVIPPPNVTGSLHIGHALNNTLQDILIRFERMRGRNVLWQPGMDHAGIATQMVVERQLIEQKEPNRQDMGREKFVQRIWEWKEESGGTIFKQLKRLGASCDWSRERFTMDEGLSKAVLEVFVRLYDEGLIYRGKRLVNWDPQLETAISDLEVENVEVDAHMWHFKYLLSDGETYEYIERDKDGMLISREMRNYISVATTRPETILGDGAIAVHPLDDRYAPIIGKLCQIPVGPKDHRRLIPIITDNYPDRHFGSGAMKITGAHDFNDYIVAHRNNIPMYRLMDVSGKMRSDGFTYEEEIEKAENLVKKGGIIDTSYVDSINLVPDIYRGLNRFAAREQIVSDIDAEGLLIMREDKKMMQPLGDRSKVVIEPMLTDQWFVDAPTLAQPAIDSVKEGRTRFLPKNWEQTYFDWMENIQPWCISRQLWWGHRIPAWYGPDGTIFVTKTEGEALEKARRSYGKDVDLKRDENVLDTWFSSALWPFTALGWPDKTKELTTYYQTDVLITAFDIIFFWVARMMMMALYFMKDDKGHSIEPFHTVYIHALVRDKNGKKMSKSKGNVIDPLVLMDEYGADALRFTLAIMAAKGRDIKLDTARVSGYRNFCTKLWNAARFAEINGVKQNINFQPNDCKQTINRWILTELSTLSEKVTNTIENYRFNDASSNAYRFVWNTFCDWYLEMLKPILNGRDQGAKEESQETLSYVLDKIYKILHPFMPFITEALWSQKQNPTLLCHSKWPSESIKDDSAVEEMNWVIDLISQIRAIRSEMKIKANLPLQLVITRAYEKTKRRLKAHESAIKCLAKIENMKFEDFSPQGGVQIIIGEATICLIVEGAVDLSKEMVRIHKEICFFDQAIRCLSSKLEDNQFIKYAPAVVIQENRDRLTEFKKKLDKSKEALVRLRNFS